MHIIHNFLEKKKIIEKMIPVSVIMFFLIFGEGVLVPIFSIFTNNITGNLFQTGIILSTVGLVGFLTAIPLGVLTDKYNIKKIMLICFFGGIFAPIFYVLSNNFLTLLLARIYFSIIVTMVWCVLWTYTFKILDKEEKSTEISIPTLFIHFATALSPILGGIFALVSFLLPFYVLSGCFFGSFILVYFLIPKTHSVKNINSFSYLLKKNLKILFDVIKKYKMMILMITICYSLLTTISGFLPILLKEAGFKFNTIGFVFFIAFLPILFLDIPIGNFIGCVGKRKAIILGLLILGLVFSFFHYHLDFML